MHSTAPLRPHIRADKFYPPRVDTPQFLRRDRILEQLRRRTSSRFPILLFEAQAGQGKTTVIKQYLDQIGTASVWFQVGPEDSDPAFFLRAIPACIRGVLPDYPSDAATHILTGGDFAGFDLYKQLDLLLADLRSCLKEDLYLVFDDLHALIPYPSSLAVLKYLLEHAPVNLHFILSSREPLPLDDCCSNSPVRRLLRFGNRELALDETEIADFFHQVHQSAVPHQTIREVARATEGWVMGVLLFGLQMEQRSDAACLPPSVDRNGAEHEEILGYFRQEIFTLLAPRLRRPLLVLSLLDEIPVGLAIDLTGSADIGDDLCELARRNIFIRQLDTDNGVFGLHHLFRQFLQEKAATDLEPESIRGVYQQAGRSYLWRENPAQALRYLLQAGDYDAIEALVKECGMSFLANNQTATLTAILGKIPQDRLRSLGWSPFFLALAGMDSAPVQALPLLNTALTVFSARSDRIGQLLSLSHILSIHITTTGHFREGEELLQRAEQLFYETAEFLDASTTILVANSLAMGYCVLLADIGQATKFATLALNLARKEHLVNFEAALLMIMGYIQIFAGQTTLALTYLEQAASFALRPEVGLFNSLAIRMMLFNFLYIDGDFDNYFDQKNRLVETIGKALFFQSIAGPFCYVWEMDIAISQGRFDQALELAEQVIASHPSLSPHLRSLVLQLQAVILAWRGEEAEALEAVTESRRLRELSGGPYFITLNKLLSGLCRARCGQYDEGIALLSAGIEDARRMPTEYLQACGLLYRAAICLETGDTARARQDIAKGLGLMHRNGYRHFWACFPSAMQAILSFAVVHGIESVFARALAGHLGLALLDDGSAIPLLEIRTLGGFQILRDGVLLLEAEDLTPKQRELLALLIAAPDMKAPQEIPQLHFWPDDSPADVKSKFDALVSRLRKTLAEVLPPDMASLYLKREKGMVCLSHCRVDALDFVDGVKRGLKHFRLRESWQAGNVFATVATLWQGEFMPGVAGEDRVRDFRKILTDALTQLSFAWCELLAESDRLPLAVQYAEKALLNDPLNDRLYSLLYRLQGRSSALLARRVLQRFETILRREGFPDGEIAELVAGIAAG